MDAFGEAQFQQPTGQGFNAVGRQTQRGRRFKDGIGAGRHQVLPGIASENRRNAGGLCYRALSARGCLGTQDPKLLFRPPRSSTLSSAPLTVSFLVNSIALFSPDVAPLGELIPKVGEPEEISTRPIPF
jgi:hypothetical protein